VNRAAPSLVLLTVTPLDLGYGRFAWSWVAGPLAALVLWALRGQRDGAAEQAATAPAGAAPLDDYAAAAVDVA
jgi:hypothetical protein